MKLLKNYISEAESKYLRSLELFFSTHYPAQYLVSHGLDHHRRVWNFVKELILNEKEANQYTLQFVENLIVACYLHDIGMAKEIGFRHGHLSRNYCIDFLMSESLEPDYFKDALESIEHHDEKEYIHGDNSISLLKFLNAGDDLDALGYIGVYRYLEIYIARGIDLPEIPMKVIKNAEVRFKNFENIFGKELDLVIKHRQRFQILINYFEGLNSEFH